MRRVAFVTWHEEPAGTADDALAARALAARGVETLPTPWTDASVDWSSFDAVILRSCWDYHLAFDDFRRWIDRLAAAGTRLWNPAALVRWNAVKTYLRDLEAKGLPVVPTRYFPQGDPTALAAVLEEAGWTDAVIKPVVSASAYETWRASRSGLAADEVRFRDQVAGGDVMVQPFLEAIVEGGEWSIVYVDGRYTHAIRKRPTDGDFRSQEEYGARITAERPSPTILRQADAVVAELPPGWLYARVDGVETGGQLLLVELELIEPSLYLRYDTTAAAAFADAIQARL